MKYFLEPATSDVYGYEDDGSQDGYIKPDMVAITLDHALRIAHARADGQPATDAAVAAVLAELQTNE